MVISNVSCDLPFSQNQPLKSGDHQSIRSLGGGERQREREAQDFVDQNEKRKTDLWFNWVSESGSIYLYLFVYNCSCKQRYVTITHIFITRFLNKQFLKIKHKLYIYIYPQGQLPFSQTKNFGCAPAQWRTEGGVWGVQIPPPEIPKALQNCAKLNPICENC